METFTLAVISLTIAVSLWVRKKKTPLYVWFSALCIALFLMALGSFFSDLFARRFWLVVHYFGALAIAPFVVAFSRYFLDSRAYFPKSTIVAASAISAVIGLAFLTPFAPEIPHLSKIPYLYTAIILAYCGGTLYYSIRHKLPVEDRRRTSYVLLASLIAALVSAPDILDFFGYAGPHLTAMAVSALLYLVFLVITHTELPELNGLLIRALVTFLLVLFAAAIFLLTVGLFWKGPMPPHNTALVASLLIIIAMDPFKLVLKKIFDYFFPESPEVFATLYGFEKEVEREKSTLLEEMATGLAHEIRNPLGSIKGAAQYLSGEVNTDNQKLLNVIIEEVDRLNSAVSRFLDYAKPYSLHLKSQDIHAVIEKAISIIRANNLSEQVRIETEFFPNLPAVQIDAELIIQVILNISLNAIDAMPEGGTLHFRTTRIDRDEGAAIALAIRDTGVGIRRADLRNIFKPFFTTKERGVGLGLAICQRIIRQHGGILRAKSVVGKGTVFYIRLPAGG